MTDLETCVNCHADISDSDGAYCSADCKHENESPRTTVSAPSPRSRELQAELKAAIEEDGQVRIGL
jgi:hypothetical protein